MGWIKNKLRGRLLPITGKKLVCLHSSLRLQRAVLDRKRMVKPDLSEKRDFIGFTFSQLPEEWLSVNELPEDVNELDIAFDNLKTSEEELQDLTDVPRIRASE